MKKTLIALAVMAAASAFAQNTTTSSVNGLAQSYSTITSPNSTSSHFSVSNSNNQSTASGFGTIGLYSAAAVANGASQGTTNALVGGSGGGASLSIAGQAGTGISNQTGVSFPLGSGGVNAVSSGQVGTQSIAAELNSGGAFAGTNAQAQNSTVGIVNAPAPGISNATGTTLGSNSVVATGVGSPGTFFFNTGTISPPINAAAQNVGSFSGTVTRP
ncbi:MAG: hypothetical protein JWQ33_420 [Ramlibacter sp.]|nr:hypothetical protein [Ramlibacter sp.]